MTKDKIGHQPLQEGLEPMVRRITERIHSQNTQGIAAMEKIVKAIRK